MQKIITNKRLIWIDSLKGIACIIVANGHTYGKVREDASEGFRFFVETVLALIINGSSMVCSYYLFCFCGIYI